MGQALCSSLGPAAQQPLHQSIPQPVLPTGEGTALCPALGNARPGGDKWRDFSIRALLSLRFPGTQLAVPQGLTLLLRLLPGSAHSALTLITTQPAGKQGLKLGMLGEPRALSNSFST